MSSSFKSFEKYYELWDFRKQKYHKKPIPSTNSTKNLIKPPVFYYKDSYEISSVKQFLYLLSNSIEKNPRLKEEKAQLAYKKSLLSKLKHENSLKNKELFLQNHRLNLEKNRLFSPKAYKKKLDLSSLKTSKNFEISSIKTPKNLEISSIKTPMNFEISSVKTLRNLEISSIKTPKNLEISSIKTPKNLGFSLQNNSDLDQEVKWMTLKEVDIQLSRIMTANSKMKRKTQFNDQLLQSPMFKKGANSINHAFNYYIDQKIHQKNISNENLQENSVKKIELFNNRRNGSIDENCNLLRKTGSILTNFEENYKKNQKKRVLRKTFSVNNKFFQ